MNKRPKLLIWDTEGLPPENDRIIILWRSYETDGRSTTVSIPSLVERHAQDLRAQYLAWVYELGETRIKGKRLVDHLELRPGFSGWWMSLFAEKCNYTKSAQITDAIRLMALKSWAADYCLGDVVLVSTNSVLAESLRIWCNKLCVPFEWQHQPSIQSKQPWHKQLYSLLPHPVQGLIWISHYLIERWPLRNKGLANWRQTGGRLTFISYLFNLPPDAIKKGRFESSYWACLPDYLEQDGYRINWLHLYVKDMLLPNAKKAAHLIRQLNEPPQNNQTHVTLDAFLDKRVIVRTLIDWIRLTTVGPFLQPWRSTEIEDRSELWPLFRNDWKESLFGRTALFNMLYLNLLEAALKSLPKQRLGVYLQENQGWEFALIHAWKAGGHGRLIGMPHSTVRYWDLRYYFDSRSYQRNRNNDLPLPDLIALNGAAALDAYRKGGYPEEALVEVEALRYLYLANFISVQDSAVPSSIKPLRVLVLGGYLSSDTQQQMRLLEKAMRYLPQEVVIVIKPHPNYPIHPEDYPGIRMHVTMEPLSKLLTTATYDVAFTDSATSAAVDAYCAGMPVVSMLDPRTLNLSPLRGSENVLFANSPEELARALLLAVTMPSPSNEKKFFMLDSTLSHWRNLIAAETSVLH